MIFSNWAGHLTNVYYQEHIKREDTTVWQATGITVVQAQAHLVKECYHQSNITLKEETYVHVVLALN